MEEVDLNYRPSKKKKVLEDLDEIDNIILPSSFIKDDEFEEGNNEEEDEWLKEIISFKTPKVKKNKRNYSIITDDTEGTGKKIKKGKKDKNKELTNFRKEFDPELSLLNGMYIQQSRFTDSLQKKFDAMDKTKSASAGVTKYTADLINAITSARSTMLQIVEKTINTKKTIAELGMKERKELTSKTNSEHEDNINFASTYLKTVMNNGRNNLVQSELPQFDSAESNDVELFNSINSNLTENNRSKDVDLFLEYENRNVDIIVRIDENGDWYFVAKAEDGEIIEDYPFPNVNKMSFNFGVGIATDEYGRKYKLENNG